MPPAAQFKAISRHQCTVSRGHAPPFAVTVSSVGSGGSTCFGNDVMPAGHSRECAPGDTIAIGGKGESKGLVNYDLVLN